MPLRLLGQKSKDEQIVETAVSETKFLLNSAVGALKEELKLEDEKSLVEKILSYDLHKIRTLDPSATWLSHHGQYTMGKKIYRLRQMAEELFLVDGFVLAGLNFQSYMSQRFSENEQDRIERVRQKLYNSLRADGTLSSTLYYENFDAFTKAHIENVYSVPWEMFLLNWKDKSELTRSEYV